MREQKLNGVNVVESVVLKGVTWGHSRGVLPMLATAQRFHELHPLVQVDWQVRSLQNFADEPIASLAKRFDLLVIDHPSIGEVAKHELLLPLDRHLSPLYLQDQARHSVGASHASYALGGHQWALATDAATPVAAARLDVLDKHGFELPATWEDLIALAQAGLVPLAGLRLDCLMYWYALCINEGATPFTTAGQIVDKDVGLRALRALKELTDACGPDCLTRNPIAAYELLTTTDNYGYSPMAYGYSNYARASYCAKPLWFGPLVSRLGMPLTSTLGGAGLAVSAYSAHRAQALDYAQFVASAEVQRGLYTAAGGQPGHRLAWLDAENNQITCDYFANTLPTLDRAFVRPRYAGYIKFQTQAPGVLARYLAGAAQANATWADLNRLDAHFRAGQPSLPLSAFEAVA